MDPNQVIDIGISGLLIAAKLAAPILVTSLVVGLTVSIFQSITQIQEVTLSFVPKAVAVGIALLVCGHWMITEIVMFTTSMFERIPALTGGG